MQGGADAVMDSYRSGREKRSALVVLSTQLRSDTHYVIRVSRQAVGHGDRYPRYLPQVVFGGL